MVFQRLNVRKKKALDALVNGLHEQAIQEFGAVAKLALHLAAASKDPNITKGLIQESDVYVALIKQLKEIPKEQPATRSNGSVAEPVKRWRPEPRPDYTFADIVGLDDVKEDIELLMIDPHKNPDVAQSYGLKKTGGGILLYGPPGTGKTSLARAVAGELGLPFFNINCNDVIERSPDKTVGNIRAIFNETRKHKRSIVYLDEVEIMLPPHPSRTSVKQAISEFLVQLDGYDQSKGGLLLIGSTNRPWEIRPAMLRPGRFNKKIYIGFPDEAARQQFFENGLSDVIDAGMLADGIDYQVLVDKTDKYTGADIIEVCDNAGRICLKDFKQTGQQRQMDMSDLLQAVQETRPTHKDANKYDEKRMVEYRHDDE